MLIAGHGRFLAAKRLGLKHVPVVVITHLTEHQKKKFMIADNQLAKNSVWDDKLLKDLFEDIVLYEDTLAVTDLGFDAHEIDNVLQFNTPKPKNKKSEILKDYDLIDPVTMHGDMWLLGKHKLYCEDALEEMNITHVVGFGQVDMIFTDPPYNVKINGHVSKVPHKYQEFEFASGEMTDVEFGYFLMKSLNLMNIFLKDGGIAYVFMDWRHSALLVEQSKKIEWEHKNVCVWAKDRAGMGTFYRSQHEFVHVFKKGAAPHTNNFGLGDKGRYRTNLWNYPAVRAEHELGSDQPVLHPTIKPLSLIVEAILDCSNVNGLILDPFGGSGSTLLAAEKTKRRAALLEISPHYCDLTIHRWQDLTGKEAIHQETGKTFSQIQIERNQSKHGVSK